MALPAELAQIETDFLSGRNPLAYIPLCHALRRQKQYMRALELCQRGLAGDPHSIAGRTLYSRLLADLGHYEEALREITKAEASAPDAMGLMVEKARCLIRLKRIDEAEKTLGRLAERNPLDPEVQLLNTQLRQLRGQTSSRASRESQDAGARTIRLDNREILARLLQEMRVQVRVLSCAVVPTGAGEPALEGDPSAAEAAYAFYRGVSAAARDLGEPSMRVGLLETENAQLIVLVRRNTLVSICVEPTPRFGKIYHRFLTAVSHLLPEALTESAHPEKEK
jgi:tetratricopeptide (TPR) repeat protein